MSINIETLKKERDEARRQVYLIKRSTSWRITAPLRLVGHIVAGRQGLARAAAAEARRRIWAALPERVRSTLKPFGEVGASLIGLRPYSQSNPKAWTEIVDYRNNRTNSLKIRSVYAEMIAIDICVVVYNNTKYLRGFLQSIIDSNYDLTKLTINVHNNSSTSSETLELTNIIQTYAAVLNIHTSYSENNGFGAGQHIAISKGNAQFILVSNIDLTFEKDALWQIAIEAISDEAAVAAWELRQKPFEHPKFYDPVTRVTLWNSHACVLIRRDAYNLVGGYDHNIFMYGEDVELSYRFREYGFVLKYVPKAVVYHFTYEESIIKPLQYEGGIFSNIYIRYKYGSLIDYLSSVGMITRLLLMKEAYPNSKKAVCRQIVRLVKILFAANIERIAKGEVNHPFRGWDYDAVRDGAFVPSGPSRMEVPLVSVITRTIVGRQHLLRQAMASVANQTYPNIEHVIVEDGGSSMQAVAAQAASDFNYVVAFAGLSKLGRSAAGNQGVLLAKGQWCLFLDDDDLLFADHVETLMNTVHNNPSLDAVVASAWQVETNYFSRDKSNYAEKEPTVPEITKLPIHPEIKNRNLVAIQSVIFERDKYITIKGMPEDLDVLEDWVLWATYFNTGKVERIHKVTSMYRIPMDITENSKRLDTFNRAYSIAYSRIHTQINN